MKKIEIVQNLLKTIEQGKFDQAESFLTDDFKFSGPVPNPVGKKEWIELQKKLNKGIPDFSFNAKNLSESGNIVNATVQIGGTQTKEIPSLMPGIPAIPATNKKVSVPKENVTITFKVIKFLR